MEVAQTISTHRTILITYTPEMCPFHSLGFFTLEDLDLIKMAETKGY